MSWGEALLGAGAGIIGGIMGQNAQSRANDQMQDLSRENLRWQQIYSKNKHRYEVEDLKNAGLNPMLAMGMTGGTTGGSSVPNLQAESQLGEAVQNSVSTAMELRRAKADLNIMENTEKNLETDNKIKEEQEKAMKYQNVQNKAEANLYEKYPILKGAEKLMQIIGIGASSARDVSNAIPRTPKNTYNPKKHYKVDKKTGELLD
jgi:hypothetical protein